MRLLRYPISHYGQRTGTRYTSALDGSSIVVRRVAPIRYEHSLGSLHLSRAEAASVLRAMRREAAL